MGSVTGNVRGITGNVILRVWQPTYIGKFANFAYETP